MSAPGKFRFISSDRRVREDRRFVVGKGNFAADIVPQGVKHVALVTCPFPAAKIVSIDKSEALAMRGVHYVLDGQELAGATNVLAAGMDTPNVPRRPLALDVARYAGEWVCAVVADTRALDIPDSASTIRWHAEAIDKLYGQVGPTGPGAVSMVVREPVGVVGAVIPWNYPLQMAAWKLGPILATGNACVIKPAQWTSLSLLRVAELAAEAGLPAGVVNVVTGPGASVGAAMLSVLLGAGLLSRQFWGLLSDRIGGLLTALFSSALQGAAMSGFLFAEQEYSLFSVSLAFGIGFSALIPAYVLAIRELYPVGEAHWRVPTLLLLSGSGMAVGGSLAGFLYDKFGYYAPAFGTGVAFNVANLSLLAMLVLRQHMINKERAMA